MSDPGTEKLWLISTPSRHHGPMSSAEVVRGLRLGDWHWWDGILSWPVVQVPSPAWLLLSSCREMRLLFGGLGDDENSAFYGWIVRRHEVPEALLGPFTHRGVVDRIASGEISYSDEIWRPGQSAWLRVGDCGEFAGSKSAPPESVVAIVDSAGKISGPSEFDRRRERARLNSKPGDASGEDLTGDLPWLRFSFLLGFLTLAAAGARATTQIEIVPLKMTSERPSMVFQTDAKPGESIEVHLKSEAGGIAGRLHFEKSYQVKRIEGEVPTLELTERPPDGHYLVEAAAGPVTAQAAIFIGTDDDAFKKKLKEYGKSMAVQRQEEKLTLFYASRDLKSRIKEIHSALAHHRKDWPDYFRKWKVKLAATSQSVARLRPDANGEFFYSEQIEAFKSLQENLKQALAEVEAVPGVRELASQPALDSIIQLEKQATDLKGDMGKL